MAWAVIAARAQARRKRAAERAETDLATARNDLLTARARVNLTDLEFGALVTSSTDGIARVDDRFRLRTWNGRFVELAGVPLDGSASGSAIEDLFTRQGLAGLFGDPAGTEQEVARRITILHTGGQTDAPVLQTGPRGEQLTMHVRGVASGGWAIILCGPDNVLNGALPPLPAEHAPEPEAVDETTEW